MRHFSLTDLDLFSAVADEQNLTRGAERVHLSAPSASLRLKKLEETLGTTLLIRSQRGTELTPAGEIVNRSAKQVQWQLEAMMKALEPWVDRERGIIRIVANYGATVDFLPEDIADFMADHPATRVILEQRASPDVVQAVAEGRADIGVSAYVGSYPNVAFIPYREDDLVIVTPQNHPLASVETAFFEDVLKPEPAWVTLDNSSAMQRFVFEKARLLGFSITPKLQVSNQATLMRMVSKGIGIGVVSHKAFTAHPELPLHAVGFKDNWAVRNIRIALALDATTRSPIGQQFAEFLMQRTRNPTPGCANRNHSTAT